MNLVKILLASCFVFMLVDEAVSLKEAVMHRDRISTGAAPLAVIKKDDSSLHLAIPHAYQSISHLISYNYDDSEEKMMIACPAYGEEQLHVGKNTKPGVLMTQKSTVLFLNEYTEQDIFCRTLDFVPSINKVTENSDDHVKHCNQLDADMYEVGYPVSNDEEGTDIQFLSTYKVCYSNIEGKQATLYSIHRIQSPDLLLMSIIYELPDPQPITSVYESVLDSGLSTKESFKGRDYYKHQFVRIDDMPNRPWKQTTKLLFNYTAITKNRDLYKGLIRSDWYIKLYSHKKNKPLNLHSGTHQKVVKDAPPVDSFWRVILDDDGNAVILVTQHTRKVCGDDYLCAKNLRVKTYEEGGCIYTCSLDANDDLLEVLGLPPLKISGGMDFTLETDKTKKVTTGGPETSVSEPSQIIGIIEFLDNESFKDALLNIDKNFFKSAGFRQELPWQ
ncbi:uncharacterized protein LOC135847293 [Planococcus citri]|uniref:uncharacterized protein LOC135847293 n=1 Tax=Planococcus citri TaxID=170843 RepID=UPI0031F73BD5